MKSVPLPTALHVKLAVFPASSTKSTGGSVITGGSAEIENCKTQTDLAIIVYMHVVTGDHLLTAPSVAISDVDTTVGMSL